MILDPRDNFLIEKSKELPVMLFKHSTRCSISSMALHRIENNWGFSSEEIAPFYLENNCQLHNQTMTITTLAEC